MIRRVLREAWTFTTVAEAQVIHDALGMVKDALGDDLSREAQLDLARVLREITIFNAPRTIADREAPTRWAGLLAGGTLTIEMGAEVLAQLEIALELMADWTAEDAKNDPEGAPALTAEQADALVALRAQSSAAKPSCDECEKKNATVRFVETEDRCCFACTDCVPAQVERDAKRQAAAALAGI